MLVMLCATAEKKGYHNLFKVQDALCLMFCGVRSVIAVVHLASIYHLTISFFLVVCWYD